MANRITTAERRRSLADGLRRAARDGVLPVGSMLPTVRELAEKHQLSVFAVSKELQILIDDGVLYTTSRVGTFVGQSLEHVSNCFLLVTSSQPFVPFINLGFEERIAQLGASSLVLPVKDAVDSLQKGTLPEVSGVFDFATNDRASIGWPADPNVPLVRFADATGFDPGDPEGRADRVYFDEFGGGRQAAEFLLRLGHSRIAFIGLHTAEDSAYYRWSAKRMQGWSAAMERAGKTDTDLFFLPDAEPKDDDEEGSAAVAAEPLTSRTDITAVIGANDNAISGLIRALRHAGVPESRWPAMLGFDNHANVSRYVVSSLRLPWEEIGRAAANLLWERRAGEGPPAPQAVSVPMRIISRPSAHHRNPSVRPKELLSQK